MTALVIFVLYYVKLTILFHESLVSMFGFLGFCNEELLPDGDAIIYMYIYTTENL